MISTVFIASFIASIYFEPVDLFVNYGSFSLKNPVYKLNEADPTWDKSAIKQDIENQRDMQDKFWGFIYQNKPRSFVIDGELFIFGSIV